eukprot:scaffold2094_cov239-Pinguiococcus_pyrenoidosus.AAC.8
MLWPNTARLHRDLLATSDVEWRADCASPPGAVQPPQISASREREATHEPSHVPPRARRVLPLDTRLTADFLAVRLEGQQAPVERARDGGSWPSGHRVASSPQHRPDPRPAHGSKRSRAVGPSQQDSHGF